MWVDKKVLFRETVEVMNVTEKENKGLSGKLKKQYVMELMQDVITNQYGEDAWEEHEELIESFIEIAIGISKKDLLLKINKTLRHCCF
jgi:hypothetical protein